MGTLSPLPCGAGLMSVATSEFSGLLRSTCALARAAAIVPMDSLDLCMNRLHAQNIKAHRTGFRALGSDAVPYCLLRVLRHQALELGLRVLVLDIGLSGAPEHTGEFRPGVGGGQGHDAHGLDPGARRFHPEEARGLAAPH